MAMVDDEFDDFAPELDEELFEVPDEAVPDIVAKREETEDAEPAGAEVAGEGWRDMPLDEEDKAFSASTQKRIKKEKWRKHEAERERDAAIAKAQALESRLAELERQEQAAQQAQYLQGLDTERKELLRKINAARDEFDEEEAERLELDLRERDTQAVLLKNQLANEQRQQQTRQAETTQQADTPVDKAQKLWGGWISKFPQYAANPAFKERVNQAFFALQDDEGLSPAHPKFYEALERRLQSARQPNVPTSGPVRGHEGDGSEQSERFTENERMAMKRLGLNPNNAKQRAEFLRTAQEFGHKRRV